MTIGEQMALQDDLLDSSGLLGLETVRDARQKRFMSRSMLKAGMQAAGTGPKSRPMSARPTTRPMEPFLSDTLPAFLSMSCSPATSQLPGSHNRTTRAAARPASGGRLTSICQAHRSFLPQWSVHTRDPSQLLHLNTIRATPSDAHAASAGSKRTSSHSKQTSPGLSTRTSQCISEASCASSDMTRQSIEQPVSTASTRTPTASRSASIKSLPQRPSSQVVQQVVQPQPSMLDASTQDHAAWAFQCIQYAKDTLTLSIEKQGIKILPPQVHRYLIAEGRCLTQLNLSNNQLLSCPPLELLFNMHKLDLSFNQLTSLDNTLGMLGQLRYMNVGHNCIKFLPDSLSKLTSLQSLDISHNQLEALPAGLGNLGKLRTLEVCHNQLHCLPPSIQHLHSLQRLSVHHNTLTALPAGVSSLQQLQHLDLAHNCISAVPALIGSLHACLTTLDLNHNELTVLPREVALLTCLTQLNLGHNQLIIPPEQVASGSILAIRNYLSTYAPIFITSQELPGCASPVKHITDQQGGGSATAVDQPQQPRHTLGGASACQEATCEAASALDEQSDLLLHLQLERDAMHAQLLEVRAELKTTREQLEATTTEAVELRQQIRTAADAGKPSGFEGDAETGHDVVELGRMVHHMRIELRTAKALVADAEHRAQEAVQQLQAETQRRLAAEQAAAVVLPAQQHVTNVESQLQAARERIAQLEELVAVHLFQERCAEDRCLEAEAKLDVLEQGTLTAWRQEMADLETKLKASIAGRAVLEAEAHEQQQDLLDTVQLLTQQVATLEQERQVMAESDALTKTVQQRVKVGGLGPGW